MSSKGEIGLVTQKTDFGTKLFGYQRGFKEGRNPRTVATGLVSENLPLEGLEFSIDIVGKITVHYSGSNKNTMSIQYLYVVAIDEPFVSEVVQWFTEGDMPYRDMPPDCEAWLPQILTGHNPVGNVYLRNEGDEVIATSVMIMRFANVSEE